MARKKTQNTDIVAVHASLAEYPPEQVQVLGQEVEVLDRAIALYASRRVTSQSELDVFAERLAQSKSREKELQREHDSFAGPVKAAVKRVAEWFKPSLQKHTEFQTVLKQGMSEYLLAVEAENGRKLLAAKAEFTATGSEAAVAVIVDTVASAPVLPTETSAKTVWKFEVTDPEAVPREYCSPDEPLLRAAVKAGKRIVPGVRIYEEKSFVVRGGVS